MIIKLSNTLVKVGIKQPSELYMQQNILRRSVKYGMCLLDKVLSLFFWIRVWASPKFVLRRQPRDWATCSQRRNETVWWVVERSHTQNSYQYGDHPEFQLREEDEEARGLVGNRRALHYGYPKRRFVPVQNMLSDRLKSHPTQRVNSLHISLSSNSVYVPCLAFSRKSWQKMFA